MDVVGPRPEPRRHPRLAPRHGVKMADRGHQPRACRRGGEVTGESAFIHRCPHLRNSSALEMPGQANKSFMETPTAKLEPSLRQDVRFSCAGTCCVRHHRRVGVHGKTWVVFSFFLVVLSLSSHASVRAVRLPECDGLRGSVFFVVVSLFRRLPSATAVHLVHMYTWTSTVVCAETHTCTCSFRKPLSPKMNMWVEAMVVFEQLLAYILFSRHMVCVKFRRSQCAHEHPLQHTFFCFRHCVWLVPRLACGRQCLPAWPRQSQCLP